MKRITLSLLTLVCVAVPMHAQEANYLVNDPHILNELALEEEACLNPWQRFHGFLFRRYAGSVEMESKTPYPQGYFGRYTYLPWKPDWVETPANQIRESQYRHHLRGRSAPNSPLSATAPHYQQPIHESSIAPPMQSIHGLKEIEVMPAR